MRFTIVTPSYNQLDWLRLCVASVRDQVESAGADGEKVGMWECGSRAERDRLERSDSRGAGSPAGEINVGRWEGGRRAEATKSEETRSGISIEHIVQDAGTPGIEDFAREMGGEFYLDGKKVGRCEGSKVGSGGYSLTIYSEKDAGMYDAINKGLRRATGEICAYLNCDEQYLPGTLAAVAEWFGRGKADEVAFGDIVVVRPDGSYLCDRTAMVPTKLHTLVSGNLAVYSAATFFRREAVVDRGLLFSPDWKVVGDSVWILSLLTAGLRMGLLRRRVSSFIYSGENLSLDAKGSEERNRLRATACAGARVVAPAIVALFRLRRMLRGGYSLGAQDYAIYTSTSGHRRATFQVERPTHRWPTHQESL
jgi:glycosyltransferase involved in cell wall biosynthesis